MCHSEVLVINNGQIIDVEEILYGRYGITAERIIGSSITQFDGKCALKGNNYQIYIRYTDSPLKARINILENGERRITSIISNVFEVSFIIHIRSNMDNESTKIFNLINHTNSIQDSISNKAPTTKQRTSSKPRNHCLTYVENLSVAIGEIFNVDEILQQKYGIYPRRIINYSIAKYDGKSRFKDNNYVLTIEYSNYPLQFRIRQLDSGEVQLTSINNKSTSCKISVPLHLIDIQSFENKHNSYLLKFIV